MPFDRVAADVCAALGDGRPAAMLREKTDKALRDLREMNDGVASFAERWSPGSARGVRPPRDEETWPHRMFLPIDVARAAFTETEL